MNSRIKIVPSNILRKSLVQNTNYETIPKDYDSRTNILQPKKP